MTTQTVCKQCNAALEEGAGFCQECGAKVEAAPEASYEDVFCPECGAKTTTEFAFCPECGHQLNEEANNAASEDTPFGGKLSLPVKPLYLGIAAAVIVVVIAAIAIFSNIGGSAGGNHLIYAKDDELSFTYLSNLTPFQMTDRLVDGSYDADADDFMSMSSYIIMSDNERYVFYPDRAGEDGVTYYWRDLKADNSKSDAAVKVDSEIADAPRVTSDGSKLFYLKGDDRRLYVYDRKSGEKNKLDDSVDSFYINDAGDYIIYDTYIDEEYAVYEMTVKGLTGEKNKIDSNSSIYSANTDQKKVFYLKEETLYVKEYNKDKEKVASDVSQVVSIIDSSTIYYLKAEEVTNKLSEFVNDNMADEDRNLTEPENPQNTDPRPTAPSQNDYRHEVWYASSWGSEVNPETNERGYWRQETDYEAYNNAYALYQAEYEAWQTEYNKKLEEYYVALEHYEGKAARDELRAALESEENAVTYDKYNLYYWTSAGETLVASDLASSSYRNYLASSYQIPVVVYQKYNTSAGGNQKMSELLADRGGYFYSGDIIWDMSNRISAMRSVSEEVYVASGETESILSCDNAQSWSINKSGDIYFLDDYDSEKGYGDLMSATVSNGSVAAPVKVDEDVMSFRFGNDNGNVYYFKDVKTGTGDLYLNGKTIASDVYTSSLYNYEKSNTLLYFIDYSTKNNNGTLCMYKGDTQSKIADDVSFYTPVDEKNIAYLTDYNNDKQRGDLVLYDGSSKPVQIDTDVTALLWSPKMMWGSFYFSYYSGISGYPGYAGTAVAAAP